MTSQSVLLAAGSNAGGQLGLRHDKDANTLQECRCDQGSFPPAGYNVLQLSAGSNHAIALLCLTEAEDSPTAPGSDMQLWACGSGGQGQLGRRVVDRVMTFRRLDLEEDIGLHQLLPQRSQSYRWRPVKIACGWNSTFIVFRCEDDPDGDLLLVLGKDNDFGQLGLGEKKWIESGVGLIDLSKNATASGAHRIDNLACGLRHTVVECHISLYNDVHRVQVLGWGAARHGQLDSKVGVNYPTSYWEPHLVDEWEDRQNHYVPESILAAGKEHTVYRRYHALKVIGSNRQGQRVVGDAVAKSGKELVTAACTWNATMVLLQDSVVGSGNNDKGQLGARTNDDQIAWANMANVMQSNKQKQRKLISLVCGSEHAMVFVENKHGVSDGQVWGWGWNEHGNLGQGNEEDQKEPVCIWPPRDSNDPDPATGVWAGCGTTFVQIRRKKHTR